jgi:hypothetical protein
LVAAASGTLAVLLAILQMFVAEQHTAIRTWLFAAEATTASLALIVVLYGIRKSVHHAWLLKRHQVERLRALQAEAIIHSAASPISNDEMDEKVAHIQQLAFSDLKIWMKQDLVPLPVGVSSADPAADVTLLRETYGNFRLRPQSTYLREAGARHDRFDHATRHVLPFLFFASVACVAIHSVFHILHHEATAQVAHVFLMLAACLPVVATGLRTYRGAVQVAHNAARFSSKASAIEVLQERMAQTESLEQVIALAWHAEQILELEYREWLRLMLSAEWFA